jgi:hypothetical protein
MTTRIPAMGRHLLAPMATTITRPTPAPRTAIMVPTISQMVSLSAWAHGTDGAGAATAGAVVGEATTVAGGVVVTDAAGTEEVDIMGGAITEGAASITAVAAGTRAVAAMAHAADMVDERVIPGAVDMAHAGTSEEVVAGMEVVEAAINLAEEVSVVVEVDFAVAVVEDSVAEVVASMAAEADMVAVEGTVAVADTRSAQASKRKAGHASLFLCISSPMNISANGSY